MRTAENFYAFENKFPCERKYFFVCTEIYPKSVIRDFGERSVMNYYQLLKKIYYFTHYNCYISCVF